MGSKYKDMIFNKSKLNYQILDAIADLVRVIDADGRVIFVNNAMEEQLGYDKKTLVCKIDDFDLSTNIANRTIQTGEVIQREEYIDGIYYSVKCSPIKNLDGRIFGAVEVFRNTSNEHRLISEIIDKNKKLSIEMAQAKKIQNSLLPKNGFIENLKVEYIYRPSSVLSGDIFDIFKIDEENFGVYISDCVGHGFASSMLTMFIKFVLRDVPFEILIHPADTLSYLQEKFVKLDLDIDNYFTFFYGVYNKRASKFTYSNAGHFPTPILVSNGQAKVLEAEGFPITKFLNNESYQEYETDLRITDKLLFMTDGVVDSKNFKEEAYGVNRVIDILLNNDDGEIDELNKKLYEFTMGEQKDDISALLLKIW